MVKVFSTPSCPFCVSLKDFLKEKGVEFEDINVADDVEAAKEMIKKSKQMGVPVLETNEGEIIIGFDRAKIVDLLKIKE